MLYQDAAVQAALIEAIGTVMAALIAALVAGLIGKQISGVQALRQQLRNAIADVHFLLEVESIHVDLHREAGDTGNKQRVRQLARERGLSWSGELTPGRSKRILDQLND